MIKKGYIDNYAGTSQRYSHILLVSEAVCRGWDVCTADISNAFLQCVTYEKLAAATGEPIREVNFELPPGSVGILKHVEGFMDCNPLKEVLHCDKPGTGLVDAPRCFSLKLAKVTKDTCGLMPCSVDLELCIKHSGNGNTRDLVLLMTKHVDDLNIAGVRAIVLKVLESAQKEFGQLTIVWTNITNCGVSHMQYTASKEVVLD